MTKAIMILIFAVSLTACGQAPLTLNASKPNAALESDPSQTQDGTEADLAGVWNLKGSLCGTVFTPAPADEALNFQHGGMMTVSAKAYCDGQIHVTHNYDVAYAAGQYTTTLRNSLVCPSLTYQPSVMPTVDTYTVTIQGAELTVSNGTCMGGKQYAKVYGR